MCINNAMVHLSVNDLPFGGDALRTAASGAYHGEEGFKTFSRRKSILHSGGIKTGSALSAVWQKLNQLIVKGWG